MRILFISHTAGRSGAPIVLLSLMKWIKANRKDIVFDMLLLREGIMKNDFANLCTIYNGWNEYTKTEKRMNRYLRVPLDKNKWMHFLDNNNYDIIYANTTESIRIGAQIKKRMGGGF